jgi:dCMP deaminase
MDYTYQSLKDAETRVAEADRQLVWDRYFLDIADVVRQKSKDASSKIGAVIIGVDKQIISTGYNGFPRGIEENIPERWERPIKYQFVEHAERNAIYNAARTGVSVKSGTLYLIGFGPPTVPCIECTKAVIQAGIVRVVGGAYKEVPASWADDLAFAVNLLTEAGIEQVEIT